MAYQPPQPFEPTPEEIAKLTKQIREVGFEPFHGPKRKGAKEWRGPWPKSRLEDPPAPGVEIMEVSASSLGIDAGEVLA